MFKKLLLVVLALGLAFIAFLFTQATTAEGVSHANVSLLTNPTAMPTDLKPCPDSPNCVSTQATNDKKRDPIPYTGSLEAAREKLLGLLDGLPRTKREKVDDNYVHYTFKTWPIPFTDDVEFIFDDATKLIHYRSASRVGHSDLGVNSKRMAGIVAAYAGRS